MTITDALALFRKTQPEDLSTEQLATLRQYVDRNPNVVALAGGKAVVETYLARAEAAATGAPAPPAIEPVSNRTHGAGWLMVVVALLLLLLIGGPTAYWLLGNRAVAVGPVPEAPEIETPAAEPPSEPSDPHAPEAGADPAGTPEGDAPANGDGGPADNPETPLDEEASSKPLTVADVPAPPEPPVEAVAEQPTMEPLPLEPTDPPVEPAEPAQPEIDVAALEESLILHFPLDEQEGKVVTSKVGAIQGEAADEIARDAGRVGTGIRFEGIEDHIIVPFELETNEITLTAWVKGTRRLNWTGVLFAECAGDHRIGMGFTRFRHNLSYHWTAAGSLPHRWYGPAIPRNEWAFLAVAVEPDQARAYVYDPERGWTEGTSKVTHPAVKIERFFIGRDPLMSGRTFQGIIDEVRIFDRALSKAELEFLAR